MEKGQLIFFIYFLAIANIVTIKAQQDRAELLDIAHWRIIYQMDMQTRKNGQPFTVTDIMALNIGQTWSVFYNPYRQMRDSLDRVRRDETLPGPVRVDMRPGNELHARLRFGDVVVDTMCNRRNGETALIFKNRLRNEILTVDNVSLRDPTERTRFRFTEHIPPQKWAIVGDTLTVLGYMSYKATTSFRGRNYTAWFTPDIPINEGPFKFYGLPGLILKIKSDDGVFSFQAIGLEHIPNIPIEIATGFYTHFRDGSRFWHNWHFIDGNLAQWQANRKQHFGTVLLGFLDEVDRDDESWFRLGVNSRHFVSYFATQNPIEFVEIEIIE